VLLCIAARFNLRIRQMDFEAAFLNGFLDVPNLFMEQPPGFSDGTNRLCKLIRSLYGLKQAGVIWNGEMEKLLTSYGYSRSRADPSLYLGTDPDMPIFIYTYVDDILLFSDASDDMELDQFQARVSEKFRVTSGPVKHFLGLEIISTRHGI